MAFNGEREIPQSAEAEQSTLGAILLEPDVFPVVADILTADDFYRERTCKTFLAMMALYERNEGIDYETLAQELKRRGELEAVGGAAFIMGLIYECPGAKNVASYANTVREKAIRRRGIATFDRLKEAAYSAETIEEVLDSAEREVLQLSERRGGDSPIPLSELIAERCKQIQRAAENPGTALGVPSGFVDIDNLTSGWQPSNLIIIAARPSMGKTSLALQFAVNAAEKIQKPVIMFSLEMSKDEVTDRLIAGEARVDGRAMKDGYLQDQDWEGLAFATGKLGRAPVHILDTPRVTPFDMRGQCRKLVSQQGPLGLIVVDYLQLMGTTEKYGNEVDKLSLIGKGLKAIAKEMNCPVICLSQLSRAVEQREDKRPLLSDLRGSGTIEEDADIVAFIFRQSYYLSRMKKQQPAQGSAWGPAPEPIDDTLAELIFAKHRSGPTGTVRLAFLEKFARFENGAY